MIKELVSSQKNSVLSLFIELAVALSAGGGRTSRGKKR
jgi:hypothetical protein